jgi:hypothetical protein
MVVILRLPNGIYPHSDPFPFGSAVKHFDLFAIDAELKDKNRNRIVRIIVVDNSYRHGIPLHLNRLFRQAYHSGNIFFKNILRER